MTRPSLLRPGAWRAHAAIALAIGCALAPACRHAQRRGPGVEEGLVEASDGVRLFYRKLGAGAPVVVVPGAFLLEPQLDALARGRTVVLYDPRDRARSSPPEEGGRVSLQADVDDLEAIRAHLGAERIIPIGWSYFGEVVALYARDHPERVDRLVQLAPIPPDPGKRYPPGLGIPEAAPGELQELARQVEELRAAGAYRRDPESFCRATDAYQRRLLVFHGERAGLLADQCRFHQEWPAALARHLERLWPSIFAANTTAPSFRNVRIPVLVVHGREDRNAPYGGGRDWAMRWPDARLVTVERAAHAVWIDDPSVLGDLDTFLRGAWPKRAVDLTGPFCGGFAGIRCEEANVCVDDPRDDCDPERGGADCAGMCVPR